MATGTGPTTRRRLLGAQLRRLRAESGLTLEAAGEAAGCSRATVNRYEGASGPVRWVVVDALCRAYGANDTERQAAVDLARNAKVEGWWTSLSPSVLPEWMAPLVTLENEAEEEWIFANAYVPGLLQTRAYAEAVHRAAEMRAGEDELARMIDVRMRRQEVLSRPNAPHLWVILDEAVISRQVGGPRVMAEQLEHLNALGRTNRVTLQVLPFSAGAHAAETTSFIIIRGPAAELDVVHIGNLTGALYLEKPAELDRYRTVFEYLRSQALDTERSAEIIGRASSAFAAMTTQE